MMVDKISGVNPLNDVQRTRSTSDASSIRLDSDSISVSDEAKEIAQAHYLDAVAQTTPDVRTELIEQIKQKIQDPAYLSEENIASAADKIITSFGL